MYTRGTPISFIGTKNNQDLPKKKNHFQKLFDVTESCKNQFMESGDFPRN